MLIGHDEHSDLICSLQDELDLDDVILTSLDDFSDSPPEHDDVDWAEWLPDVIERADPIRPTSISTSPRTYIRSCSPVERRASRRDAVSAQKSDRQRASGSGVAVSNERSDAGSEAAVMALPMYHAYGYSVLNTLLELALDILVVPDARDTALMSRLIERHAPIIMLGVPTQFMEIVDEELENDVIGISGSAPLADETKSRFEHESRGISQGYGLSEMSPITHFNVHGLAGVVGATTLSSTGPFIGMPVPDTEVELVDVDSGEEFALERAADEELEGEMYVNGPQRMKGYLDEEKRPFDEDGFVATGDVAKIDAEGRFYIVDRVKNMINVSGLKVYSEEVDELLFSLDGVKRPATIGVPDPEHPGKRARRGVYRT